MEFEEPKIDIRPPQEPGGNLWKEYKRIFNESNYKWILFMDTDVLLLNRNYYTILQRVINNKPNTGLFTCTTNDIGCDYQRVDEMSREDSIKKHLEYSRKRYEKYRESLIDLTFEKRSVSGFFMLINKEAWFSIEDPIPEELFGLDVFITHSIRKKGWPIYLIPGLYCYHMYIRDKVYGSLISEEKTSVELWEEREKKRKKRKKK